MQNSFHTNTQKYSHHRFPSCCPALSPIHWKKRRIEAFTNTPLHERREYTRREVYASKSKERMHLTTNYFACFRLLKKVKLRLVFSENLLLPRLRGTQRCWFCFVLRFFKQSGEISTQTYYTHWKKSLWAIVKHTNTTTTLAHTESDTKRVKHGTKGWNKSELEHVQDTNTETLSRVDTWDTYTINNTNTTNIHTYIHTYTHMWH